MINYTKEQLEAIDYFDSDLIISASAGSGKTQVLLEKVVKLVSMGYKINDMLIVTFTNLAASEMKTKLENMLEKKFCETKDGKFFDAIKQLNVSNISTIHSFCQKLVKKYYYELHINPNFEIKDDNFLFFLKNLALENAFNEFLAKRDSEFVELSNLFVYKRDYNLFKEEILSFYDFLVSKVDKFDFCNRLIEKNYEQNINQNELISKFRVYCTKNFEIYKKNIENLKLESLKVQSEKLEKLCTEILSIIDFDFSTNEKFVKTFFGEISFPRISISNKSEAIQVEVKEKLQKTMKSVKEFVKQLKSIFDFDDIGQMNEANQKSKKLLLKFVEVVKVFEKKFLELKQKYNCLDFNDLEVLTLKLFENENILNEICSLFKFVFVDEYQDTNLVQEEILKKIAKNSKRIMVGDLKQSIYAFRECNPKILNDKMNDFLETDSGKVVELNKNFRSRKEILEFSNKIFSNLMRKENCDYDYYEHGMFVCGRTDEQQNLKPISILCVNKQSENIKNAKQNENILVLNAINNLLEQKIVENGIERNLQYCDIAIISRKRNEKFNDLCEFLQKSKIPINVKFYEKIYQSFEVKLIFAYLKIINNTDNEICLASVLKNFYDVSDNDIITIKNNNFVEDVLNYCKKDAIFAKISKFKEDLEYFGGLVFEVDNKTLIKEIIKRTQIDLMLLKKNGKISESRLQVFLNSVPENKFDLNEFLVYSEKIKDKKFEVKKIDAENSVVVDTFHSTKGLEYNAVIIVGAGEAIFSKNKSNLIYNANFGIGIYDFNEENKVKNPNMIYSIIKILNKQEEFNEEVRLCYVAFTRAKNFMVICGAEKLSNLCQETNTLKFLDFNSYFSLIFSQTFDDYVDCQIIDDDLTQNSAQNSEKLLEEKTETKPNYELFDRLFEEKYPFENSKLVQLKNSVTSLSEEDNLIYNISNFKVTDQDKEDYIALGNAYHHTLEKLQFGLETEKEVHEKIVNLIGNKELEANVYSFVEDAKILKAINAIKKLIDKNDKIFKEKVFLMNLSYDEITGKPIKDKILVQGIIDLMIEKENEIILIDYKTSRLNDINLIKKYALQLNLYEKAISEAYPEKKITKYIYSIFLDKLINVV
ncbi:MAG: UvrD-helicase domain-containing protein [Christensenellales bacterium]